MIPLMLSGSTVLGQIGLNAVDSTRLDRRVSMENSVVILKNGNGIIPMQGLDTLNMASVSSLSGAHSKLIRRIDSYLESDYLDWRELSNLQSTSPGFLKDHNLYIISIDTIDVKLAPVLKLIKSENEKSSIVLLIRRNESVAVEAVNSEHVDGVLWSDDRNIQVHDIMIQALFGGLKITGLLAESLAINVQGALVTEQKIRLNYDIPEVFNISGNWFEEGISKIAQQGVDSGAYPGCQILVAKSGRVIFQKSFGFHTYAQDRSVKNSDLFDIASVTKVTAATLALMQLYDQDKIGLDEPMSNYWPRFINTNKSEISVRSVLAHHARLKSWIPYYKESQKKNGLYRTKTLKSDSSKRYPYRVTSGLYLHKKYKTSKLYKMIDKSPLNEEPGYVYSGLSFYLYPQIVKDLTSMDFSDYLQAEYYKPLGASTVGFRPYRKYSLDRIVPTEQDGFFRMELLHGQVHDEGAAMMLGVSGNAGLFANANDLAKIWQMLLNEGSYGGKRYLKKATIAEFTRCQFCDEDNRRGLGFDKPLIQYDSIKSSVAKKASPDSFGHSGYTGTLVWADPTHDLLFIFLSNRVHPTRENRRLYQLNIRPRIHDFIYGALVNEEK